MENDCQNNQEQIAELIAGTLPVEEAVTLQEHLSRCPTCSKYMEALRADDKLLGDFVKAMRPTVSRIENNVAEALDRTMPGKAASSVSVWRKIMKSRITKFATAAVIIIGVLIGIHHFGGSIDGASVAWARVRGAVREVAWMHMVGKSWQGENEYNEFEHWVSLPTETIVRVSKIKPDRLWVVWSDFYSHKREFYDSASKTLTLEYQHREFDSNSIDPMNYLRTIIEPTVKKYAEIKQRKGMYEGEEVNIYELNYDEEGYKANIRFLTDISSNLPININFQVLGEDGKPKFSMDGKCDYPEEGPSDIYDVGVPRDTVIVNKLAPEEVRKVIDIRRKYRENFIAKNKNYILIFTRGAPSRGGIGTVYVCYKRGELQRIEQYHCSPARKDLKDLENDFDLILKWAKSNKPVLTYLYAGKYWHLADYWQKNYERSPHRCGFDNYLPNCAWEVWYSYGEIMEDEYSKENNLIAFDLGDLWRFYINPKYDYILQRREEYVPNLNHKSISEVKEYAKTERGQWYPKIRKQSYAKETPEGQFGSPELGFIEIRYLQLNPEFPNGIFEPNNLPKEFE